MIWAPPPNFQGCKLCTLAPYQRSLHTQTPTSPSRSQYASATMPYPRARWSPVSAPRCQSQEPTGAPCQHQDTRARGGSRCVNAQVSHGKGHHPSDPLISKGGPQYGLLTHLQGWQPHKQFTFGGQLVGKGFCMLDLPFPPPQHPTSKQGFLAIYFYFSSPDFSDKVILF